LFVTFEIDDRNVAYPAFDQNLIMSNTLHRDALNEELAMRVVRVYHHLLGAWHRAGLLGLLPVPSSLRRLDPATVPLRRHPAFDLV
jgi:hypothetical protein